MNSPFYEAEQKRLYPNRKHCKNLQDVTEHIKHLIKSGTITLTALRSKSFKNLMNEYFVNADTWAIVEAFNSLKQ